MAKEVVKENIVTTQEGTELTVKPLTIRSLRKFMAVIEELNEYHREVERRQREFDKAMDEYNAKIDEGEDVSVPEAPEEDDFAVIDIMLKASKIALEKHNPEFVENEDNLEDELDMNVLNEILEIAGGIKLGDPNQLASPGTTARA